MSKAEVFGGRGPGIYGIRPAGKTREEYAREVFEFERAAGLVSIEWPTEPEVIRTAVNCWSGGYDPYPETE